MLKYSHFPLHCRPKSPGCKSEKDKYFALRYNRMWFKCEIFCGLLRSLQLLLQTAASRWVWIIHIHTCGVVEMSHQEQKSPVLFLRLFLSMRECLSSQNKHPRSSSQRCVLLGCAHGPAARTNAPLGSPAAARHPGTSTGFLEGWVGAEYFGPALDLFPPPLSYFPGMVHAEDARSVAEASCACPALPSCWRVIYRCSFASSSVPIKEILEKGKEHEEISVNIFTYWLPGLSTKRKKLKILSP